MAKEDKQEPNVKTVEEYHERAPRRWPALVIYLIIALLVAALLVFGARAIYRHYHKPTLKTVQANTKQRPTEPATNNSSSPDSGSKNNSSPKPANGQSASTNGTLPNSGPGQVVGLFVGTTLAAAGLHYVISLRRSSKAN